MPPRFVIRAPAPKAGRAAYRPSGLAVGPDGALYISDDSHGRIWRVTFQGGTAVTGIAAAPAPRVAAATGAANVLPPEGIHTDAGAASNIAALPAPPGATPAEVALGARIFHGQTDNGTCEGCHGSEEEASNTDAWFTAFAPALHPKVVICVMLVKDGAGGDTAAPLAREVLETALSAHL